MNFFKFRLAENLEGKSNHRDQEKNFLLKGHLIVNSRSQAEYHATSISSKGCLTPPYARQNIEQIEQT